MSKNKNEVKDLEMVEVKKSSLDKMNDELDELRGKLADAEVRAHGAIKANNENLDKCKKLQAEYDDYRAQAVKSYDEMTDTCRRLQAEFDNYRKRTNETNKKVREEGKTEVLEKILPVVDAIIAARKMISDDNVAQGLDVLLRQIDDILSTLGVVRFDALGKPFDPNFHNAIMQQDIEDESLKGCVVQVYQDGYMINDKILRHAVVIVGK